MTVLTGRKYRTDPISRLFSRIDHTAADSAPFQEQSVTDDTLIEMLSEQVVRERRFFAGTPDSDDTATNDVSAETEEQTTASASGSLNAEMLRLELAVDESDPYDVSAFVAAYQAVDWSAREAEDFVRAVNLALGVGAHLVARECALSGAERFPNHPELKKMAHVLAPPQARVVKSQNRSGWKANRQWLHANWDEYRGRWVALRDGELLAVANSLDGLVEQVGEIKGRDILVTPIG